MKPLQPVSGRTLAYQHYAIQTGNQNMMRVVSDGISIYQDGRTQVLHLIQRFSNEKTTTVKWHNRLIFHELALNHRLPGGPLQRIYL